jgi:hypothetical protein
MAYAICIGLLTFLILQEARRIIRTLYKRQDDED